MIYWDYNATAPVKESVKKRVQEALEKYPGNPSSTHQLGQSARAYIEKVRRKCAEKLKTDPSEIIFTGSATETNMVALRGHCLAGKCISKKILASRIEHPSVCANIDFLSQTEGIEVVEIPRRESGQVDLSALEELLKADKYFLCSLQGASNETGIIQPWKNVAELCHQYKTPFHSDMVQVFGRLPFELSGVSGLSTATISFHKSGGIRGSSILYLNREANWKPNLVGGGQEKKRWAGTENILSIASIEALFDELDQTIEGYQTEVRSVRDLFESELKKTIPDMKIVGEASERLPNTSFCIFPGIPSDAMLMALDVRNICASAGSACSSGMSVSSTVLKKLGFSDEDARSAIRFSLGESSTKEQIPEVIAVIKRTVEKLAA